MADEVRSSSPVSALGGFAGRTPDRALPRSFGREAPPPRAADRVSVPSVAGSALQLLRERVLARTRILLAIDEALGGPEFAEVTEGEPLPAFLGRLLSAQNQLAAHCAGRLPPATIRHRCDEALRAGAAETLDLLTDRRDSAQASEVMVEVLAEYGRRLAAMAGSGAGPSVS